MASVVRSVVVTRENWCVRACRRVRGVEFGGPGPISLARDRLSEAMQRPHSPSSARHSHPRHATRSGACRQGDATTRLRPIRLPVRGWDGHGLAEAARNPGASRWPGGDASGSDSLRRDARGPCWGGLPALGFGADLVLRRHRQRRQWRVPPEPAPCASFNAPVDRGWFSGADSFAMERLGQECGPSNCTPSCATGKLTQRPARLTLSSPGLVGGHRVYRCFQIFPPHPRRDIADRACIRRRGTLYVYTAVPAR